MIPLLLAALLAASRAVPTQTPRSTGMVLDIAAIQRTPRKVQLTRGSYRGLPRSASLEQYCPTPGDQGQHGTCVAFASAYHLATILYAKQHALTDRARIDAGIFSPTFLYEQIKNQPDADCQNGSDPIAALLLMMEKGLPSLTTVPYSCDVSIGNEAYAEAQRNRLSDASLLFGDPDVVTTDQEKIEAVKKALAEGFPVLGGFEIPESFYTAREVWSALESDTGASGEHGKHAMAVVAYDDDKGGGAFELLNSWGPSWGSGGFVWMRYADFARWSMLALEVFDLVAPEPEPAPETEPDTEPPEPPPEVEPAPEPEPAPAEEPEFALRGTVQFQLSTGGIMRSTRVLTRNLVVAEALPGEGEDLVAYRMLESYPSGTRFRFFLTTDTEAHVYAFATDLGGVVNRILPYDDLVSTHVGAHSTVALPSETKVIQMDEHRGTDYLLILYSTGPLDSQAIAARMSATGGGLSAKIRAALGAELVAKDAVAYAADTIGFELRAGAQGNVVPLMVELSHR